MKNAMDAGSRDPVSLGEFAETHAAFPIAQDSRTIDLEWLASQLSAFESGAPHPAAHSLTNQTALEFGNQGDDGEQGSAKRTLAVDIFPQRDELDAQSVQLIECFQEMTDAACHAIE